ncbi:MAG: phage antirepressor [Prevotellaceae bacterium]|nr:phage antirepressor [Prevotellaceae bacterium]
MSDIQIFNNEEFGEIRTAGTPEQPLFCLADVARVLGLRTSKLVQRLTDDVLSKYPISDSLGREQVTNFINEDGLYDVILDSRKPEAKRFRKWVTSEVLPTIRKHGAYMTRQAIEKALAEPDFLIQLAGNLKEERQKRLLAEQECECQRTRIVELGSKVDNLQNEVTEMKDKVTYLDIILATKSSVLVTQIAQDYGESSIRFNRRLKDMNIQYQRGRQWILYAGYKDCGYVTSETYLIKHKDGTEDVRMNTKWTQKGRRFLYERLKSAGVVPVIERTTINTR